MNLKSFFLMGFLIFISCNSDSRESDVAKSQEIKKYEFLDARSYTDWIYFSFSKGEIVKVNDYQNDANWDVAFHRGNVRLNGGKSGKGGVKVINTMYYPEIVDIFFQFFELSKIAIFFVL